MRATFPKALGFVLSFEGYKSNDPNDPGGRTILGISERAHPDIVAELWDLPEAEARARAGGFYLTEYWEPAGCDFVKSPLDVYLFDTAVNLGLSRAAQLRVASEGPDDFLFRRIAHYVEAARPPKMRTYLRGWVRRVVALREAFRG